MEEEVMSWNDLPKPLCPKMTLIIDTIPENTPEGAVLYFASDINEWDPGSRYWMFDRGPDGKYFIEIPRPNDHIVEFKVTRGNWGRVECRANGDDIDNRILRGGKGEKMHIVIIRWKDL
jgi:hypothetical protein